MTYWNTLPDNIVSLLGKISASVKSINLTPALQKPSYKDTIWIGLFLKRDPIHAIYILY